MWYNRERKGILLDEDTKSLLEEIRDELKLVRVILFLGHAPKIPLLHNDENYLAFVTKMERFFESRGMIDDPASLSSPNLKPGS